MNEAVTEARKVNITPLLASRVVREYLLPMFKKSKGGVTYKEAMVIIKKTK